MSRATLTAVYYSRGKGIQFDTMDALCEMFWVGVGELLVHTKEETSEEIYRNDTHRC
ncbi:helix-turn-helix transcriptional regulator [Aneurinibacillus aneurinilyticus]|uniref:helix-turn-helix domain-containing protein n=1 Tax=Aneurinibacillus aneurinilyticus TaxID=1391 RepID=UPI002E1D5BAD|nr:helix-turn-helix transcriptional regulator [Aneurinibacillus aneurinilyticus]